MSAKTADASEFLTKKVTITNRAGIHARPAAMIVKIAARYACEIFVEKDDASVNGKSILGLMTLAAGPGSTITLRVRGADANAALAELEAVVKRKFDEE